MNDFIVKYWIELFLSLITSYIVFNFRKILNYSNRYLELENATKAYLRAKIIDYYFAAKHNNSITLVELESVVELYKSYKSLGGNGSCDKLYEEILDFDIIQ